MYSLMIYMIKIVASDYGRDQLPDLQSSVIAMLDVLGPVQAMIWVAMPT